MSRIFITGDVHCPIDIHKLNSKQFPQGRTLTKDDYVIICGDAGFVWDGSNTDKYWQKWIRNKPWTTLFVDGNHENFDMLNSYPVEEWNGGKVHRINDSLFHLVRGQVFNIDGKSFFTFGGASSHDKETRIPNKTWWAEELPSMEELEEGFTNLDKYNYQVDYIVTHCAPSFVQQYICDFYEKDILTNYFDAIEPQVRHQQWFCGHYHMNHMNICNTKINLIYDYIVEIK